MTTPGTPGFYQNPGRIRFAVTEPPRDTARDSLIYGPQKATGRLRSASQLRKTAAGRRTRNKEIRAEQEAFGGSRQQAARRSAARRRRSEYLAARPVQQFTPGELTAARRSTVIYANYQGPLFDDMGRIGIHPGNLALLPIDTLRDWSDKKAVLFYDYLGASDTTAQLNFNEQAFQARRDRWTAEMHARFLASTYEQWRAYVSAETRAWQASGEIPGTEPSELWYHGMTRDAA